MAKAHRNRCDFVLNEWRLRPRQVNEIEQTSTYFPGYRWPGLGRLFGGRFRRALEQLPLLLFVFLHCFLFFLVRFPLSLLLSLFLRLLVFVECLLLLLGQLLVLAIIFRGRALGFSWHRPSSAEED